MAESVTISRKEPALKSMNYVFLREQGIQHIQKLAAKLWTNYNSSDPGLTILEVLSYAITDLGYRSSYEIKDLMAADPSDPAAANIRNFFTACQILPNAPVTINDYRKLLMDVDIHDSSTGGCEFAGVKNAWIECSHDAEQDIYVWRKNSRLDYVQDPANNELIIPGVLYNVLLELGECDEFGDLNENTLEGIVTLYSPPGCGTLVDELTGIKVMLEIEFPRWDDPINWEDPDDIKQNARSIILSFQDLPPNYRVEQYYLDKTTKDVKVVMYNDYQTVDTTCVETVINNFLYDPSTGLVDKYKRKVRKIMQIVDKVKATLMANRNLCEDFLNIQALKVEEIALCADIELAAEANVEEAQAAIYHEIGKFLSPTVYFYDLEEMFAKGKTSEEIFEGPKLEHGFIDDEELKKAERRKSIHVSDLISIIMDIPGILAVKSIQIANIPLDNDDNIQSVSAKWCLDLSVEYGYVPRLSTEHSSVTFFKNQLPYKADELVVEELLEELKDGDREQKLHEAQLDIPVPEGEYKNPGDYTSIQEDFPLVYGIGSEGLSAGASTLRKAQARQLKGFLMFFDQLLANYLIQLANIRELFAMNEEKDASGDYIINRSYFTKNLINIVPDAAALYIDQANHAERMDQLAENTEVFESRRNKFLDHLMARFAEQFTDYALLSYKLTGAKTGQELIEDKLAFINAYPEISSGRDKAFNYEHPCSLWHVDNVSGLEKRVSLLSGIEPRTAEHLAFTDSVNIFQTTAGYEFEILDTLSTSQAIVLSSVNSYATIDEARLAVESTLVNGVVSDRYVIIDSNGKIVDQYNLSPAQPFEVAVICNGKAIARASAGWSTLQLAEAALEAAIETAMPVVEKEFYENHQSNRYNKSCLVENYFDTGSIITDTSVSPPTFSFSYTLYSSPFDLSSGNIQLLTGTYTGTGDAGDTVADLEAKANEVMHDALFDVLKNAIDPGNYKYRTIAPNTQVIDIVDRCNNIVGTTTEINFNESIRASIPTSIAVEESTGNNGSYTVVSTIREDRNIHIEVLESIPDLIPDGIVTYTETFTLTGVSQVGRSFSIASDVSRRVFPGESITISGSTGNDGIYTIERVKWIGTETEITVSEKIPASNVPGSLEYTKRLQVLMVENGTNGNFFTVRPGADAGAAAELAAAIREKFFSNEGMHVIEHILLRPRTNESVYIPISASNGLLLPTTVTSTLGNAEYTKIVSITGVTSNKVILAGNIASEFYTNKEVTITGSYQNLNDRKYKVASVVFNGINTEILLQSSLADISNTPYGELSYQNTVAVTSVDGFDMITINEATTSIDTGKDLIITGADDTENNGTFLIDSISTSGDIILSHRLTLVQDAFLPINMNADCEECRITDPYSFVASVVLPYWQGRFMNMDFRRFFERTLRMEAPAHVALNICWVSCSHMKEFEEKYKRWITENAKRDKDKIALSKALGELIDILVRLRSVYPPGTLHDCSTDPGLKNSIILNNSIIGNCNN